MNEESTKDLLKYYKYLIRCKSCNQFFGSDYLPEISHRCPICDNKFKKNMMGWKKHK